MTTPAEYQKAAKEIFALIKSQPPQVLYILADFMDLECCADEGMFSQSASDAAEKADVYTTDGKPQSFVLSMGMSLPDIKVTYHFENQGEEDDPDWRIEKHTFEDIEK